MPFADATLFQSELPAAAAIDWSESPDFACDIGLCPGVAGTRPSPWKLETRIFC